MSILSAGYKLKQFAYSRSFPNVKLDTWKEIAKFECQVAEGNIEASEGVNITKGDLNDAIQELRGDYDVETVIPCDYSSHYESKSVAKKIEDGTWIGWTFWYGGGKHSDPEAIEWLDDAYYLDCKEEDKVVTVRTFKKK